VRLFINGRLVIWLLTLSLLVAGCQGLGALAGAVNLLAVGGMADESPFSYFYQASRERTWVEVSIFDPIEGRVVGSVSVVVGKTSLEKAHACEILGTAVTKFLEGDELSVWPGLYVINRLAPTEIDSHDLVTAVLDESSGRFSLPEGEKVVGCITGGIHEKHPRVRVVPPDEFRRTAFPDLTPEEVSSELLDIALLVEQPEFQERIAPLGIRYLILAWGVRVK
jgi:hypothetical protein